MVEYVFVLQITIMASSVPDIARLRECEEESSTSTSTSTTGFDQCTDSGDDQTINGSVQNCTHPQYGGDYGDSGDYDNASTEASTIADLYEEQHQASHHSYRCESKTSQSNTSQPNIVNASEVELVERSLASADQSVKQMTIIIGSLSNKLLKEKQAHPGA